MCRGIDREGGRGWIRGQEEALGDTDSAQRSDGQTIDSVMRDAVLDVLKQRAIRHKDQMVVSRGRQREKMSHALEEF